MNLFGWLNGYLSILRGRIILNALFIMEGLCQTKWRIYFIKISNKKENRAKRYFNLKDQAVVQLVDI